MEAEALDGWQPGSSAGSVWNVSDMDPAPRPEVMRFAVHLLDPRLPADDAMDPPNGVVEAPDGVVEAPNGVMEEGDQSVTGSGAGDVVGPNGRLEGSASTRGIVVPEKRVVSSKIREELGVTLLFPTYREGLAAIAAGDLRPFTSSAAVDVAVGGV